MHSLRRITVRSATMLAIAGLLIMFGATSLVLTAAASTSGEGETRLAAGTRGPQNDQDNGKGDGDDDDGTDDDDDKRNDRVRGEIITRTDSFAGDWVIATGIGITQTVRISTVTDVKKFEGVLPAVGDYIEARGTRLSDNVLLANRIRPDKYETQQLVVRLVPEADVTAFADEFDLQLVTKMPLSNDVYLFQTTEDEQSAQGRVQGDKRTRWVEFNFVSRIPTGNPYRTWEWGGPEPTGYLNQTAYDIINARGAQPQYTGSGILVAVLDTGIDLEHPVFSGTLEIVAGSNILSPTALPDDEGPGIGWGHGTHVAGIIRQIAPASRIMPVRVLDSSGRGNSFALAYAIEWAAAQGADVLNLSLGADCDSDVLSSAIESAIAQQVIVVAAAGNAATEDQQCPAGFDGVISVTAVDGTRVKAPFANFGTWVKLAAPGVGITSTIPISAGERPDYLYAAWSGTSMATPFVSAAAALVRQKLPASEPISVTLLLQEHATSIDAVNPGYNGKVGRLLDVGAALADDVVGTPVEPGDSAHLFLPAVSRN